MNSIASVPSRWRTYAQWLIFLLPALFLWLLAGVFIVPKLQQICVDAGLTDGSSFWRLTEAAIQVTLFARHHAGVFLLGTVLLVGLLEWRSGLWPRYRGVVVGAGTFMLNFVVLASFFVMMTAFAMAAPALAHSMR